MCRNPQHQPLSLLVEADERSVPPASRRAQIAMQVMARFPLLHSVFWLTVVVYTATRGTSEGRQLVMKLVIEAWLLYSFSKYMLTGTTSLYGLSLLSKNTAADVESFCVREGSDLRIEDVVHIVAIPNYKESASTLRRTLETLAAQRDAKRSLVVVLAMEARDPHARSTSQVLQNEFSKKFRNLFTTLHAIRRGEVGGKSSNENWAVRCAARRLEEREGVDPSAIVVTVCDADTYFHSSYFAALSAAFAAERREVRATLFWQGAPQFYPNSDDVPVLCSVRYALLSVGFLGQLASPIHFRLPFAVYSISLDLAKRAGYWDPAVIPEDWHMFLRCFYATGGKARVRPLFFPIGCECVTDAGSFKTIKACYHQAKRWQWGAIDIGFIAVHSGDFGLSGAHRQLRVALAASEHHLYYPLMWIVLAAAPWLVDDWATGWRFQLWIGFYTTNFFFLNLLDYSYRRILANNPESNAGGPNARRLVDFSLKRTLAFAAFPLADFFLFVIPSLHAHARMALSTQFDYVVAPKLSVDYTTSLLKSHQLAKETSVAPSNTTTPSYSALVQNHEDDVENPL